MDKRLTIRVIESTERYLRDSFKTGGTVDALGRYDCRNFTAVYQILLTKFLRPAICNDKLFNSNHKILSTLVVAAQNSVLPFRADVFKLRR